MNDKEKLINALIKEKGGTREQYENLLNSIAYHESAGTMSSTIEQIGGGPGRGKYQFEVGKNRGAITAARRLKQYYEKIKETVPKWLINATKDNSLDVSKLTSEQQDMLFLGNMRMHPKANLANVISGKESIPDFWANYHWAGKNSDRDKRLKSFNKSYEKYISLNPQEINNKLEEDKINNIRFNNQIQRIKNNPIQEKTQIVQRKDNIPTQQLPKINVTNGNIDNLVNIINQRQQLQQKPVQSQYNNKNLTEYNGGGTHQQNPLGGIPMGYNTSVESNETSFKLPQGKFIFSDRIDTSGNMKSKLDGSKQQVSNSYNNQFAYGGEIDPPTKEQRRAESAKKWEKAQKRIQYVKDKRAGEEANAQAYKQSLEQAKTELAKEQVFEDMQKVYQHPLGQPGMFSPFGAEDLILSGVGKGMRALRGIKPLEGVLSKTKPLKSEIDWGKWNKDIPNNRPLMDEYNTIEATTKKAGTWMKNPDGSAFKGTPEQFVQQNSENFRRAFGNNYETAYRGSGNFQPEFKDKIVFATDSKDVASTYTAKLGENINTSNFFHPNVDNPGFLDNTKIPGKMYEFFHRKSPIVADARGSTWFNIQNQKHREMMERSIGERIKQSDIHRRIYNDIPEGTSITTDDYASFIEKEGLPSFKIKNVVDVGGGAAPIESTVKGLNTGAALIKSRWYNDGMFDMTNPNIYKTLVPAAIGVGAATQNSFAYGGNMGLINNYFQTKQIKKKKKKK